jgi:hypothetical protein
LIRVQVGTRGSEEEKKRRRRGGGGGRDVEMRTLI